MKQRKPVIRSIDDIDPVVAEATRWFVELHDNPAGPSEHQAFHAWREADTRHAAAYDRLQRLWGASGHLESLIVSEPAMDRRSLLRGATSASVAIVSLLAGGRLILGPHPFADHSTRAGERRMVLLPDRSRVELSAATALSIDFSGTRRLVRLLDGEAWFQVEPDSARPFVVEAADGTTTALGTAFAVAKRNSGALVTVTEHAVSVTTQSGVRRVDAGQSLLYGPDHDAKVRQADPATLLWRSGRLAFINRPLREVAAELDRWSGGHTIVADKNLAGRPVTLMTSTDDAGHGLMKLAGVVPMRIMRLTSLLTVVRSF